MIFSQEELRPPKNAISSSLLTGHSPLPPYETNILRNLFGRENVTVFERQSKTTITPEQEYDRLCAKYGHEVVAKVFGEDGSPIWVAIPSYQRTSDQERLFTF